MENFVHVKIHYSSNDFSDVLGMTTTDQCVACFIERTCDVRVVYPCHSQDVIVSKHCVFDIPHINIHCIPYMRYGSLALLLQTMFPNNDFNLINCKVSVIKIFQSVINYNIYNKSKNSIHISHESITINNITTDFSNISFVEYVMRDNISKALSMVFAKKALANVIILQLPEDLHFLKHSNHANIFQVILKLTK